MHPINWYCGWAMILAGFIAGAILGLFFWREDFLGGYGSFRRRLLRLGHIALPALGAINVLFSISSLHDSIASIAFLIGGVTMPLVCWLTSWRTGFRHLFFVPVSALILAVIQTMRAGPF